MVTNNLDGDIDIFTLNGLRPLTKIPVFAGVDENETGRVIYLRKFEKLILRVQGRTPNDEPATFQIKFAGSFEPLKNVAENKESGLPEIKVEEQGENRVNSVGGIIEPVNKPTPEKADTGVTDGLQGENKGEEKEIQVRTVDSDKESENVTRIEISKGETVDDSVENDGVEKSVSETGKDVSESPKLDAGRDAPKSSPRVIVSDPLGESAIKSDADRTGKIEVKKSDADRVSQARRDSDTFKETEGDEKLKSDKKESSKENSKDNEFVDPADYPLGRDVKQVESEKLANINLVVTLKDGKKLIRAMDTITWFNVDKGILTIILNDGKIMKFSMLEVEKINFETLK